MNRKNKKCLAFVLVQVTRILKKKNIFFFMLHKIKNISYSRQWNSEGLKNIKLVSHYSKSVSRKSSKCLDFVLAQRTHKVQKGAISHHATQNEKMAPIQYNGIARASKISN